MRESEQKLGVRRRDRDRVRERMVGNGSKREVKEARERLKKTSIERMINK